MELSWFTNEEFHTRVAEIWNKPVRGRNSVQRWNKKMSALRNHLRGWAAIPKLMSGGHLVTTQEEKQNVMFEFYEGLIGTALPCTSTLNLQQFHNQIVDLKEMGNPITEEEVWDIIKPLLVDRAPGPDGYSGRFYKACWQLIKADFMAAIITLQQDNAQKLELLNLAYLTLIPKKEEAFSPADFSPISLVHSFTKLITKVLANRLAKKLNTMISTNQSAFIRGWCIHDNFILVQQTIKLLQRQKVPSLFLKLDISKVFDSVSWAFLLEVLNHLGFGNTWCNLISDLLTTSTTRVLLNSELGATIKHQRGLRQGDPLPSMLFIIVMDVWTACLLRQVKWDYYSPYPTERLVRDFLCMQMM
jgi:hypothetical protein